MDEISITANQFQKLVNDKQIEFETAKESELIPFVRLVVEAFLTKHKLGWKLGMVEIGNSVCLKIDDEYLQYLDIYPDKQKYQWSGEGHNEGIMPDDAMKYMIELSLPGTKIEIMEDGSIILNDNIRLQTK